MEDQLYYYHAEMCKAFSHPKRLELINTLRETEMTVNELSEKLGLSPANLSQHLAMMRERRILIARKEGNLVFYRIANTRLLQIFDSMQELLFEQLRKDAALLRAGTNKNRSVTLKLREV